MSLPGWLAVNLKALMRKLFCDAAAWSGSMADVQALSVAIKERQLCNHQDCLVGRPKHNLVRLLG